MTLAIWYSHNRVAHLPLPPDPDEAAGIVVALRKIWTCEIVGRLWSGTLKIDPLPSEGGENLVVYSKLSADGGGTR